MLSRIDWAMGRRFTAAAVLAVTVLAGSVAAAGSDPAAPPADPSPVATGHMGGEAVAVAAPPVPPTTAEVAVAAPPVPPTAAAPVAAAPTTTVPLDPDVVAEQVTSLVVGAAKQAALAVRR